MANKVLQPTYKRQRFLLAFIRQLERGARATDIQKLVFLYSMQERTDYYEFVPYMYGPYSFQLAEDIDILKKNNYIGRFDSYYKAIGEYQCEMQFFIPAERGDSLIKKAYREYPYYAINSEILDRLFRSPEIEKFRAERQHYANSVQMLFTIGYEGKSIESFMNTLIQNDIHLLCDVRKNPLSRKFGFSKDKLQHITEQIGIKYIHIPDLGIESEKRADLVTIEDYQNLFADYEQTLPSRQLQLEHLYSLLNSNKRIALMCYEKEPEMCHRHVIRDYLIETYKMGCIDL